MSIVLNFLYSHSITCSFLHEKAEAGDKLSSGCESHEENTVTSDSLGANNEEESVKSEENPLSATSDAQLQVIIMKNYLLDALTEI